MSDCIPPFKVHSKSVSQNVLDQSIRYEYLLHQICLLIDRYK